MRRLADDTNLSSGDRDRLQAILDRFEQAGQRRGPVDLAAFLPPPGDRLHALALGELIKCDLELRWGGGQPSHVEDYLKQYPELSDTPGMVARLLHEEYLARQRHGDKPILSSYRDRFPDRFAELERLVRGHDNPTDIMPAAHPAMNLAPDPRKTGALLPVLGGYTLVRRIGSGSFGEVWHAEAPGGVEAAIKVIFRPLNHAEAKREMQSLELMKHLRHPFLLQTQAFWSLEDRLLIAMELADGSLRDRLTACVEAGHNGIPVEELFVYAREACEALDYLHSKQVLHRDIKPDNILLLEHHVKVADFGLARVLQAQLGRMTVSGTPAFMPPESWTGKAGERSDQYSLAGSYAEVRLNRHLFPSTDMAGAMMDHLERTPDLAPLPEAEQQVLLKALAKKPEDRYATCTEFWEALRRAVGAAARARRDDTEPDRPGTLTLGQLNTHIESGTAAGTASPATLDPTYRQTSPKAAPRRRLTQVVAVAAVLIALCGAVGLGTMFSRRGGDGDGGPDQPDVYLPQGFQRAGEAKVVTIDDRPVYDRVAYVLPDKTDLVFTLVPKGRATDPEPFYILCDKVTNQAFAQFNRDNPGDVRNEDWKLGASGENDIPLGVNDYPFHPVMRVTVDDANRFAGWLNGRLPTAQQWDKAAGRFDGAVGPFAGDGAGVRNEDFGVGLGRLLPANRQSAALSLFGCRDMAGNGYEWTCSVRGEERETIPFDNPNWNERVSLRGQTYFAPSPYRFADRPNSRYRFQNPQNGESGASAEVGFRVILELPARP